MADLIGQVIAAFSAKDWYLLSVLVVLGVVQGAKVLGLLKSRRAVLIAGGIAAAAASLVAAGGFSLAALGQAAGVFLTAVGLYSAGKNALQAPKVP
jgi:hypothetical protein